MSERGTGRGRLLAPIPKHRFRDSAIANAVLAVLILLVAWLTGGSVERAFAVAVGFFAIATAWNWLRLRRGRARQGGAATREDRGP